MTGVQTCALPILPYVTDEETKKAFDKINPNKHGVLPVLVVMENRTGKALRLDLQATYVSPDGGKIEATPAEDVIYIDGVKKVPKLYTPLPNPIPRRGLKKGPLNIWQIPGRSFGAKLVPPGESASGFVYFQTDHEPGSKLYLTGIRDAASGKDYFYFEVPLERQ